MAVVVLTTGVPVRAQPSASPRSTRFVVDGNRMYAELAFVRPDGSVHRALAFVDMGSQQMTLRESLFTELQLDRGRPLVFRVGELSIQLPATEVVSERREPSSVGADLRVEAVLPASVLQRYEVVIDYRERTIALAAAAGIKPEGAAVPFHLDEKTGLIAVDATIDGKRYAITIDNGSAYTWVRQSAAKDWLASHPGWVRGVGAVGPSNMTMSGDGAETSGTLMRIPEMKLGPLALKDVGALAAGPGRLAPGNLDLFDWYSQKNAVPVIGWIGGNVLKAFRLTIDYAARKLYLLQQQELDTHDLDQVGLTLRADGHAFFVAGVATKNGKPTVERVVPGDRVLRVGSLDLSHASWGAVYAALHGKPGEQRSLLLERGGRRIAIATRVTAF
jgi:hypothetical protein